MKKVENPASPYDAHVEYFDGLKPDAPIEIYEDATRSILSENKSPDLGFRWSLNPYRGCIHACAYCYARPSHEYLGFGAGSDFETKIVVKKNAAELLRKSFLKLSWKGERIVFSGDTDCYQPIEATYKLTQACLKVCLEFGNPVSIITKSFLITRDLDLLKALHERTHLGVTLSIPFKEEKTARIIEPHAASIERRFEALQKLSEAGIKTGINIAPLIPGLNDSDIPYLLKRAKAAGAEYAGFTLLRLPGNVKNVFISRIKAHFPLAADKILGRMMAVREGKLYQAQWGKRFTGSGEYWENTERLFWVYVHKFGLNQKISSEHFQRREPFRRPTAQKELLFSEI